MLEVIGLNISDWALECSSGLDDSDDDDSVCSTSDEDDATDKGVVRIFAFVLVPVIFVGTTGLCAIVKAAECARLRSISAPRAAL